MRERKKPSEDGFTMLAVIFLLAILTLTLAIALPKVRQDLQRDREREAMQRGKQYRRAVQLYFRKYHKYPPSLDALKGTDGIRFLREEYVDPVTGKNDWQPILFGQNKVPTVMGFFGQAGVGSTIAGTGPGGGAGLGGSTGTGGGFGTNSSLGGAGNASGSMFGGSNTSGSPFSGGGSTSGIGGNSGTSNSSSDSSAPGGQTFGGAGIIGVTIPSEKQALLVYKGQDHYNLWEFDYDPAQDAASNIPGAGSVNGLGGSSPLNGGSATGGLFGGGNGTQPGFPSSPNGNLPPAPAGPGQNGIGNSSPNGNLPPAQQQ
jgi:type II secretory pathway pseudopilin PulG